MAFKIVAFALCLVVSHAANLHCDYDFNELNSYRCKGSMTTTRANNFVDSLDGTHEVAFDNNDVISVSFDGSSIEILPRNLRTWFKNFNFLELYNITNYPNLKRCQFYDCLYLQGIVFKNLPGIGAIGKDTLWDLEFLKLLVFDSNPNLQNLDADFLVNSRILNFFGVMDSPKFNTIPAGFFRNQDGSLKVVSFRGSGLISISYSTFNRLRKLESADFTNAGCMNRNYYNTILNELTPEIHEKCKDAPNDRQSLNQIFKKLSKDFLM